MSKKQSEPDHDPLCVEIFDAKPNEMFTPELTAWLRFLRYNRPVPCAECGKKKRNHWTMLCAFKAVTIPNGAFALNADACQVHPPLTPVCTDHPLAPHVPKAAEVGVKAP